MRRLLYQTHEREHEAPRRPHLTRCASMPMAETPPAATSASAAPKQRVGSSMCVSVSGGSSSCFASIPCPFSHCSRCASLSIHTRRSHGATASSPSGRARRRTSAWQWRPRASASITPAERWGVGCVGCVGERGGRVVGGGGGGGGR